MSEITDTIYLMRVEEAAEMLIEVLGEHNKTFPDLMMKKAKLIPIVAKRVAEARHKEGYHYIPTVMNRVVREPNEKFIENQWSDISPFCAEAYKKYIVWSRDGVRLGTLEEYTKQQECIENINEGVASAYNRRSTIIRSRGGEAVYLNIVILQLPEGEELPAEVLT